MKQFFLTIPRNIIRCFTAPVIIWHILAIILSVVCVLSGFDWFYYNATRSPRFQVWMFPAVPIGGLMPVALPLALLVGGWLSKNLPLRLTGWATGQAALIGSLISSAYKSITGRAHPLHNPGTDISRVFHFGFLRGGVFWGWPSSHTTIALAVAATIYKLFPQQKWLGILAFTYALYIGTGVSITIHWFSDFAAGAIIGTVIGIVVGKSYQGSFQATAASGCAFDTR